MADNKKSLTHKYIPSVEQMQNNLFIEEYYSGTDTTITINDDKQLEISYLQFAIQEQLKPLYGYASRTFDDIAVGNRVVLGTMRVTVRNKEPQSTMDEIKENAKKKTTWDYIDDFNAKEEAKKQDPELVEQIIPEDSKSDSMDSEYIDKMIDLGYIDKDKRDNASIEQAIKKLQESMEIDITGTFTEQFRKELDDLHKGINSAMIKANTSVHLLAGSEQEVFRTVMESPVKIYPETQIFKEGLNGEKVSWIYISSLRFGDEEMFAGYVKYVDLIIEGVVG